MASSSSGSAFHLMPIMPLQLSDVNEMIGSLPSPDGTSTTSTVLVSPVPDIKTGKRDRSEARGIPANLFDWSFDVRLEDEAHIATYIMELFDNMFNWTDLCIPRETFDAYIREVSKHYHNRPFHNFKHACTVTHITFMLMRETFAKDILSLHQQFSLLMSAVVHDIDHPGNTNLFEVNSGSKLALLYNDLAVLENHHCSQAFLLMKKPNTQFLSSLSRAKVAEIRQMIIECIMATDMSKHNALLLTTSSKTVGDWSTHEDRLLYGKLILHLADLSNPVRDFKVSLEWAKCIATEFNNQYVTESEQSMPVLGFMKLESKQSLFKNEFGFNSFIAAPMWREAARLFPALGFLVQSLEVNLAHWEQLSSTQSEEIPQTSEPQQKQQQQQQQQQQQVVEETEGASVVTQKETEPASPGKSVVAVKVTEV